MLYRPHPAWDTIKAALLGAFAGVGTDLELALRLYHVVRQAGFVDAPFRPCILSARASEPMIDYLPSTVESLCNTVLKLGLLGEAELAEVLAQCRAHLRQPDAAVTIYKVAQVWGPKPSSGRQPAACWALDPKRAPASLLSSEQTA